MSKRNGHAAIIEQFLADGIDHMFGNPGTVEQGFLDALGSYPEMKYILTLQETVAVMIADGYARARQRPALVQIHSSPGLGNAIGALYQAKRGHAPLVVIGGDAGIRYQAMDAQMAADLVAMAEPVTKWATMVHDASSVLRVLRRAIKIAATPPMGPVYVCLPQDVLDEENTEAVIPTVIPSTRVAPDPGLLREAAQALASAQRPMFFVGDGVAYSGARAELERLAELVGAEVWESDAGEVNISYRHPLYQGMTGHMFGAASRPITSKGDAILICGTYMLPEVFPELGPIFAPGAKVIHIDLNAYEIAKNHPVDIAMLGDPKVGLGLLADQIEAAMSPAQREGAQRRAEQIASATAQRRDQAIAHDQAQRDRLPMPMSRFMADMAASLPADTLIFDEALTSSPPIGRYAQPAETGSYFLTRGGSLGVGFPGAIGAKLANPDRPVIGFSGDGGSMYTIQALWTAARYNVDVTFVVCNNGSYRLLQSNIDTYWAEREIPAHEYPLSFDLSFPPISFVDLARALGVGALRVSSPDEIGPAIQQARLAGGPVLIDLVLAGDVHPERIDPAHHAPLAI
ncbi:thiamine pyrophosphate-binding protein [Chloroflexia bacterium SDU3-3]|nr:thiamine pyrophosphate-binding protein [Chloroflexia bacterium SDU3-3]